MKRVFFPSTFLVFLSLLFPLMTARAVEQEFSAGASFWRWQGEDFPFQISESVWPGFHLGYSVRLFKPLWGSVEYEQNQSSGRSPGGSAKLELQRQAWSFGLQSRRQILQKLELGLALGLGGERLEEDVFSLESGALTSSTRLLGWSWSLRLLSRIRLGRHLEIPASIGVRSLHLDGGAAQDSTNTNSLFGTVGLAWRWGAR